jgi:hypothetical protein
MEVKRKEFGLMNQSQSHVTTDGQVVLMSSPSRSHDHFFIYVLNTGCLPCVALDERVWYKEVGGEGGYAVGRVHNLISALKR